MIGSRLGPYEVTAKLGEGGMGVVFRALDSRLGREVAIKVLPPGVTSDPDRLARFQREAKLLAQLNHPNIAQVYGLEVSGGTRALVMELVEGPTLAEALEGGALPLDQSLEVAVQIAQALEAAHQKGIVHRDLKPQNIKMAMDGRFKVLDFGLAKALAPSGAAAAADSRVADSPTLSGLTTQGMILGTAAYMAPEQARAGAVDQRADVWAFGVILYEMLSGRRLFRADSMAETLAEVLKGPIELAALPAGTPVALLRLLRRCLERDPQRRMRDFGDVRLELEEIRAGEEATPVAAPATSPAIAAVAARRRYPHRELAVLLAVGAVVVALVASWLARRAERAAPTPSPESNAPAIRLTQLTFSRGLEESPALSPEGGRVVYAASSGEMRALELLDLESRAVTRLTSGERDEIQPAWFPDGKRLLFVRSRQAGERLEPGDIFGAYSGGDVWERELESGRETRRLEEAFHPDVSPDGRQVAVSAEWAGGTRIWIVDANGSNPVQISQDSSEAILHLRPRWSPDGSRIVFYAQERTRYSLRLVEVANRRAVTLTDDIYQALDPIWHPSGRFVYFSSYRSGGLNLWRLALSPEGTPAGLPQPVTTGAGQDLELSFTRAAPRGVFAVRRQNADLWRLPLDPATGTATGPPVELAATTREDSRGAWSPDGRFVAFNSDRAGDMNLWLLELATGSTRQLTTGTGGDFQPAWSPDGERLVFFSMRGGSVDLWSIELATGALVRLTSQAGMEINPFYSPDGREIAFQSDASGRLELWIAAADGSAPRQLTEVGLTGHFLRWLRAGEALLFRCSCGGRNVLMEVASTGGEPHELPWVRGGSHLSLSPDQRHILDVDGHRQLWLSPYQPGEPRPVFELPDAADRIDYPVWSPDGQWVVFDRFRPDEGDLWLLEERETAP